MRRHLATFVLVVTLSADAMGATYVGRVQDSDLYIAIERDRRKIGGYLCDDGNVSRWIEYRWLRKGQAPLIAGTTGERLGTVKVAGSLATGTVELEGRQMRFSARRVRGKTTGLFFAVGKQPDLLLVGGWILHPDGTQRGAVSRVNTRSLQSLPPTKAPALDPRSATVQIGQGNPSAPPVVTDPEQLVVINIIAILIGLLIPAVQS